MEKLLLTPKETSQLLGIHVEKIRSLCKNSDLKFPCIKNGNRFLVIKGRLEQWLKENEGEVL